MPESRNAKCQTQAKPSQESLTNPSNQGGTLAHEEASLHQRAHYPPSSSSPWPTPLVRRKPRVYGDLHLFVPNTAATISGTLALSGLGVGAS